MRVWGTLNLTSKVKSPSTSKAWKFGAGFSIRHNPVQGSGESFGKEGISLNSFYSSLLKSAKFSSREDDLGRDIKSIWCELLSKWLAGASADVEQLAFVYRTQPHVPVPEAITKPCFQKRTFVYRTQPHVPVPEAITATEPVEWT
ncbi:hypothetical protein AVEN_376-1 [Araneus ventricosus]|uniref:Uncharacterized protein n=1 Tax=Araneus ventricosus TaxID=182803 RepID=A0A4Y2DTG6_ARAVE|nr:hypothetical protein AVEN_376-1 [Araneus ventricosus]